MFEHVVLFTNKMYLQNSKTKKKYYGSTATIIILLLSVRGPSLDMSDSDV